MPDALAYSAKTFGDLLLEMAVAFNLARLVTTDGADAGTLALPSDGTTLAKLKMKLNQGYMNFIAGIDPSSQTRPYTAWTFLTREVSITLDPTGTGPQNIAGDSARYRLPDGITSAPKQHWTMDGSGAYANARILSASIEAVRDQLSITKTTAGCPERAACRPIASPDHPDYGKAWEVIVSPRPSIAATMTADFRVQARPMTALSQRHVAGPEHDQTILAFGKLAWLSDDDREGGRYQRAMAEAVAARQASIDLDKRSRGMVLGRLVDPSVPAVVVDRGVVASGQRGQVSYTVGVPVTT
jgi:hypothetical protein